MNRPSEPAIQPDRPGVVRLDAAAIADVPLGIVSPGSLLLRVHPNGVDVLASGVSESMSAPGLPQPDRTVALPDRLLMPALVNAHTHLDLTHIGPIAHDPARGFVPWVEHIRTNRHSDPDQIAASVRWGIELSIAGGSAAVGDIAGAPLGRLETTPARVLAASGLAGVSFLEFFGIGASAAGAIERIDGFAREGLESLRAELAGTGVRVGLQPHATNTVDLGVYRWVAALAARLGLPLATHLAETMEERRFIERGDGPQRAMLERFGVWDESVLHHAGRGLHPVAHLEPVLRAARVLCAHVNDASDAAVALLAETQTPVVYCPRASEYFGARAHFGPHRYDHMLRSGVPVCLGTDSIVNLDTPDRISVLDEMRVLARRDGAGPGTLMAMSTTMGARALGLDEDDFTFEPGPLAGLLAIPLGSDGSWRTKPRESALWAAAMGGTIAPEVLFMRILGGASPV